METIKKSRMYELAAEAVVESQRMSPAARVAIIRLLLERVDLEKYIEGELEKEKGESNG